MCNSIFEDDKAWTVGGVFRGFESQVPLAPEGLAWVPAMPQGRYVLVNASDLPDWQDQRNGVWSDSDDTSNAAISASNPMTPIGGWPPSPRSPTSPTTPHGVATPDHIRSPEACCTICLQRYNGPHGNCRFCGDSPAYHCGHCCYKNAKRTTGPYDRLSCPEATTQSKAPAASSWQGANLVRSLNDRLTRLEAAQIAPPPYKAPPTERQLQEFAKSHPMPKAKAPIFPDGQAVYPKGLPVNAAAPPKCRHWHPPLPKSAVDGPRGKERGETAMADHSVTQHFSIPGNRNVFVFPALATPAQR